MILNKRGQSIIEYSIMAVLVVIGIVVMGPYVLRSVNSHFKMWDDQAQDSTNERLKQAPAEAVTLPGGCTCGPAVDVPGACGGRGALRTCAGTEILQRAVCTPINCQIIEECRTEPSCCIYVRGDCGSTDRSSIPANRYASPLPDKFKDPSVCPPNLTSCYKDVYPLIPSTNTCYFGEREVISTCGGGGIPTKIGCIKDTFGPSFDPSQPDTAVPVDNTFGTNDDDPSCAAVCTGSLLHGELCTGTGGVVEVNRNAPLKAIGTGSGDCNANSYKNCEFYCIGDFVPSYDTTHCVIKAGYAKAPVAPGGISNYNFNVCVSPGTVIATTDAETPSLCPMGSCCVAELY